MKPAPSPAVESWLRRQATSELFTTAVTQAEILYGAALLPKGKRRSSLEAAVTSIFEYDFSTRILPFDAEAAFLFAKVMVLRRAGGRPMAAFDAQIAAIALSRKAELATRDTADFEGCGVTLRNPWTEA